MSEVAAYRVRTEDGYVWVDPKTKRAQPDRKFIMPGEEGIDGQSHKLQALTKDQFDKAKRGETPVVEAPMNRAMSSRRMEFRSKKA